jgi:DNA-binding CsgD family transcriptional regulator
MEPAPASEVAPLIFEAYDLTPREAQVAQLVLRGLGTDEISSQLCISALTVQQHLKAIFDKTGVRSRRDLVAQIFTQRYLPHIHSDTQVRPDGWFAAPRG